MKKAVLSLLTSLIVLSIIGCNSQNSNYEETNANNVTSENNEETINQNFQLKSSHDSSYSDNSDEKIESKIAWYSLNEGLEKAKKENKYIFIDFYTDWCTYCKQLDSDTFSKEVIYNYVNNKLVPIKVNAESETKVVYGGKEITERELALNFQVQTYPTLFFMQNAEEAIGQIPGFVDAEMFHALASYVVTDAFKTLSFEKYQTSDLYKKNKPKQYI